MAIGYLSPRYQRETECSNALDKTYLFEVVVVRRNTDGRLEWRGLYRRQLHPQQCSAVQMQQASRVQQSVVSVKRAVAVATRI